MGRAKIKRGSTNIDMTAMCDVAFLLLSFFILTTKFKPAEAVEVVTPTSVSSKAAAQTNVFTVTLDKEGRVYIDMSDEMKGNVIQELSSARNLGFSADDVKYFKISTFVGAPFNQLKQFIRLDPAAYSNPANRPGIPVDSTNNELQAWINAALNANKGEHINFLIKGDNAAKYPSFKGIIEAFKKNDIYKYQLVTNPEGVPEGTALWQNQLTGKKD
jgi:biopolymer transport protein ExbD